MPLYQGHETTKEQLGALCGTQGPSQKVRQVGAHNRSEHTTQMDGLDRCIISQVKLFDCQMHNITGKAVIAGNEIITLPNFKTDQETNSTYLLAP